MDSKKRTTGRTTYVDLGEILSSYFLYLLLGIGFRRAEKLFPRPNTGRFSCFITELLARLFLLLHLNGTGPIHRDSFVRTDQSEALKTTKYGQVVPQSKASFVSIL